MAQNKIIRTGPVALTSTLTTNILNPPTVSGGVGLAGTNSATYLIIRHIRIVNVTGTLATFTLAVGATGATPSVSNSVVGFGTSVAANSFIDWYGQLRLKGLNCSF